MPKVMKKRTAGKRAVTVAYRDQIAKSVATLSKLKIGANGLSDDVEYAQSILIALCDGNKIKVRTRIDVGAALAEYDLLPLECDGLCRVLTHKLTELRIKHKVFVGYFTVDGAKAVPVHWWIELADGMTVDYRAQMWAGKHADIPHGVFRKSDFPKIAYVGTPQRIEVDERTFKILTTPKPDQPTAPAPAAPAAPAQTP